MEKNQKIQHNLDKRPAEFIFISTIMHVITPMTNMNLFTQEEREGQPPTKALRKSGVFEESSIPDAFLDNI